MSYHCGARSPSRPFFFFFNDTATTEIYTLSLHDALPILPESGRCRGPAGFAPDHQPGDRSEEHTSELQSHLNLVCRLLLEKKKKDIRHDGQAYGSAVDKIHVSQLDTHVSDK